MGQVTQVSILSGPPRKYDHIPNVTAGFVPTFLVDSDENPHGYHQYGEEFCGPSDKRVEQYDTHYQVETKKQKIGIDLLHQPAQQNPKELLCSSDAQASNSVNETDSSVESRDHPKVTEESFAKPEGLLHVQKDSFCTKNCPMLDVLDYFSDEFDDSGSCSSSVQRENVDSSVDQTFSIEIVIFSI